MEDDVIMHTVYQITYEVNGIATLFFLTLVWKLKTVTKRQTAAVMPRHITTDLVL